MNRKTLKVVLASIGVLGIGAAVAPAVGDPVRPAAVLGRVVDASNRPVEGARVALMTGPGEVVRATTSNAQGQYEFKPVRPGRYAVGAAKPDVGHGHTPPFLAKPGEITRAPVRID